MIKLLEKRFRFFFAFLNQTLTSIELSYDFTNKTHQSLCFFYPEKIKKIMFIDTCMNMCLV